MRTWFRSVDSVHVALCAALGLPLVACGGHQIESASDAGAPPTPTSQAPTFRPCVDPTPIVVGGQDTGFDSCQGGATRRRAILDCPSLVPRASRDPSCGPDGGFDGSSGACAQDTDCAAQPNGACLWGGPGPCTCTYGCVRDSDCGTGAICLCGDPIGTCTPASCTSESSCGDAGAACATYEVDPYCGGVAFACQTLADQCLADGDCVPDAGLGACVLEAGARTCSRGECAIGRPFLVAGEARVAPVETRGDWRAPVVPRLDGLGAETRHRLAGEWVRVGQMEHASIAAFARFALQLLAVGAPPSLLAATHRAMGDETRHATLAFGLASAYAGRAIGPGPLSLDACLDGCDFEALLGGVLREGCLGETVAAVEACEALARAEDPVVRAVLAVVARDETRHAELAWRTVAWALDTHGERAKVCVEAVLADLQRKDATADNETLCADDLLRHGVIDESLRAALRASVFRDVVLPCARAVLASSGGVATFRYADASSVGGDALAV